MLDKKSISILLICCISFLNVCKGSPTIEQVPGIHKPLIVQEAEVTVQIARVRHNVQTYYLTLEQSSGVYSRWVSRTGNFQGDFFVLILLDE